jgi:hypothetical protein
MPTIPKNAYLPDSKTHYITYKKAKELVKNFKKALPGFLKKGVPDTTFAVSELFAKDAVMDLLKQKGCAGLRIYNGLNKKNLVVYVLIGVDKNAKNINGKAVQISTSTAVTPFQKKSAKALPMTTASVAAAVVPVTANAVILEEGVRCPPFVDVNGGV